MKAIAGNLWPDTALLLCWVLSCGIPKKMQNGENIFKKIWWNQIHPYLCTPNRKKHNLKGAY
jgi:hypothetical protein